MSMVAPSLRDPNRPPNQPREEGLLIVLESMPPNTSITIREVNGLPKVLDTNCAYSTIGGYLRELHRRGWIERMALGVYRKPA
jgi:hypothetical protein